MGELRGGLEKEMSSPLRYFRKEELWNIIFYFYWLHALTIIIFYYLFFIFF